MRVSRVQLHQFLIFSLDGNISMDDNILLTQFDTEIKELDLLEFDPSDALNDMLLELVLT